MMYINIFAHTHKYTHTHTHTQTHTHTHTYICMYTSTLICVQTHTREPFALGARGPAPFVGTLWRSLIEGEKKGKREKRVKKTNKKETYALPPRAHAISHSALVYTRLLVTLPALSQKKGKKKRTNKKTYALPPRAPPPRAPAIFIRRSRSRASFARSLSFSSAWSFAAAASECGCAASVSVLLYQ
jgi:hypothetical protein